MLMGERSLWFVAIFLPLHVRVSHIRVGGCGLVCVFARPVCPVVCVCVVSVSFWVCLPPRV